jgi:HEAT repeats
MRLGRSLALPLYGYPYLELVMAISTRRLAIATSFVLVLPSLGGAQPAPPKKVTIESVREILWTDTIEEWRGRQKLVAFGSAAFPVYDAILADPNQKSLERARIFDVLKDVKADRKRYIEPAIRSLSHSDHDLRLMAVQLLGKIGSEKDTAPVVALLADEEAIVVKAAAETLAEIGGWRELVALDAWLRSARARELSPLWINNVQKPRDALKKRIDDAENRTAPPPRLAKPQRP